MYWIDSDTKKIYSYSVWGVDKQAPTITCINV